MNTRLVYLILVFEFRRKKFEHQNEHPTEIFDLVSIFLVFGKFGRLEDFFLWWSAKDPIFLAGEALGKLWGSIGKI